MPKAKSEQIVQVIVNPRAADGRAQKLLSTLQEISEKSFVEYKSWSLTTTLGPRHACQIATDSSADVIVAVGGDGTFHEVINGLMSRETVNRPIFAPIDFGTGGDLAKSLALPAELETAFALCAHGETRKMDVGQASITTEDGTAARWFINVGGFGANGEGSQGVHDLVDNIAHRMAEERGEEIGCDKKGVLGLCKQRTRCAIGVAAVRARAVARAARRPLVCCSTAQANRLLAGSCSAPNSLKTPGQGGLQLLTAMVWKEDAGNRGPRGLRGD